MEYSYVKRRLQDIVSCAFPRRCRKKRWLLYTSRLHCKLSFVILVTGWKLMVKLKKIGVAMMIKDSKSYIEWWFGRVRIQWWLYCYVPFDRLLIDCHLSSDCSFSTSETFVSVLVVHCESDCLLLTLLLWLYSNCFGFLLHTDFLVIQFFGLFISQV